MNVDDIEVEAQRFWREQSFYNICCDDDDCEIDLELVDDKVIVNMMDHNYTVTIHRIESMAGMKGVTNPIKFWDSEGVLSHFPKEIEFWNKVAELYQTVPLWMLEFDDLEDVLYECNCETSTIVQQGCQCGGV